MTTIKGILEPFSETGTEGIVWSFHEDGVNGYDGLNCLDQGDYLKIFDPTDPSKVVWEGNIDFEYERNYRSYPMNPKYGQQAAHGYWVHGFQKDVEPETWAFWFLKEYPAELTKSEVGHLYRCKSSTIAGYKWAGRGSRWNTDREPADLTIKFKNGTYYRYKNVDFDTAEGFADAKSMGKYHTQHIKNKFEFEKIDLPGPIKHNKPHGSNVAKAWPFPTGDKP